MASIVDAMNKAPAREYFAPPPGSPEWFKLEDDRRKGRTPLHGRPLDDNGGVALRPLECRATPCRWAGIEGECVMGCERGTKPAPLDVSDLQPQLDAIIYDHGMTIEGKVDGILALVRNELVRAMKKWPPVTDSPHHHWAVLAEEFQKEMTDEVFSDNIRLAREEALQVAAMAVRFVLEADLPPHRRKPSEAPAPRPTCAKCGSHPPYHQAGCDQTEWTNGRREP